MVAGIRIDGGIGKISLRIMDVLIPAEVIASTGLTPEEFRVEIAVHLYEIGRMTLEQASKLAEVDQLQFQALLAEQEIPLHYGVEDLEEDIQTLKRLGRL
jgi:predicted HTH domain antitoxin